MALQAPLPQHETNGHDAPSDTLPAGLGQRDVRDYLQGALRVTLAASSEELDRQFSSEESVRTFSNFLTSTRSAFYVQKTQASTQSISQFTMR
jgi:hypothetical protein